MLPYHDLLNRILLIGTKKDPARPGMPGTISLFGEQIKFDLSLGLPLLTTKKIHWKNIITELLWFMRGDTHIKFLVDRGCNIWNDDAYRYYKQYFMARDFKYELKTMEEFIEAAKVDKHEFGFPLGELGRVYGKQWRDFNNHDQLKDLISSLKHAPESRRHILSSWNPSDLNLMALPPCHLLAQFNCRYESGAGGSRRMLDCHMYMRSADAFLGVPYNIASYAMLTEILCAFTGYKAGELIISFGDVHLYDNHIEAANTLLKRDPEKYPLPYFSMIGMHTKAQNNFGNDTWLLPIDEQLQLISQLEPHDFAVENYNSYPAIKAELSVGV